MRAVVQRVERASVDSRGDSAAGWERVGEIGVGMVVLVGVTHDDDHAAARRLADKLIGLRIFDDADGTMNLDLAAVAAAPPAAPRPASPASAAADVAAAADDDADRTVPAGFLVVSQFTLYGDTRKGRRPSWVDAARPEAAERLVDAVVARLRELAAPAGLHVATGRFRTEMRVELINDGPVTLIVET